MKYRLAVFDMDGTILNTLDDIADSVNYTLERFGYPTRTREEIRTFVGSGIKKLMQRACPPDIEEARLSEILPVYDAYYLSHCACKTGPYPGVISLLRDLRAAGVMTAVVSNKSDDGVRALCRRYFDGLFDAIVGERSDVPTKPAPDMVEIVLTQLGVKKADAVYIGDSDVDVATARNSGLDLIAVTWGFRPEALLRSLGAACIAHDTDELKKALLS